MSEKPEDRKEKIKSIENNKFRKQAREESLRRMREVWGDPPKVVKVDLSGNPVKEPEPPQPDKELYLPPHERGYHGLDPKKRGNNNR